MVLAAHGLDALGAVDVYLGLESAAPALGDLVATLSPGEVTAPTDVEQDSYIVTITAAGDPAKIETAQAAIDKKTADAVTETANAARPAIDEVGKAFANIATLTGKGSEERKQLDRTLKELQAAARSIKVWAEYLERNPEALIRGKGKSKRR